MERRLAAIMAGDVVGYSRMMAEGRGEGPQGELDEARGTMAELVAANTGFSLASEVSYRRFGNSPLMERYLSELAQAQAPRTADSRNGPGSGAT